MYLYFVLSFRVFFNVRIIQNYVIWRTMKSISGALPSSVRDAYGTYREVTAHMCCNLDFDERKSLSLIVRYYNVIGNIPL